MARMSRADLQAQTRAALIGSARELFAERGYTRTTIDEIAARAGFSRGAFYGNFTDKGDIFLAILEHDRRDQFAQLAEELEWLEDEEILGRLGEWLHDGFFSDSLRRARAEFTLAAEDAPGHRARLAATVQAMRQLIANMIRRYSERHGISLAVDY